MTKKGERRRRKSRATEEEENIKRWGRIEGEKEEFLSFDLVNKIEQIKSSFIQFETFPEN